MERLKRFIVKEELVILTGDLIQAMLLDLFINRVNSENDKVYMSMGELYKEFDFIKNIKQKKIKNSFDKLLKDNFIRDKGVNTYYVNLSLIDSKLREVGYYLEGFTFDMKAERSNDNINNKEILDNNNVYAIARENGFNLNQSIKNYLDRLCNDYNKKMVKMALYESGLRKNKKIVYIEGILKNWKKNKIELSQANPFYEEDYKNNKGNRYNELHKISELTKRGWNQ